MRRLVPTDASRNDYRQPSDCDDVFGRIDAAIFEEYRADTRLATDIVHLMHTLPGEHRALVYDFQGRQRPELYAGDETGAATDQASGPPPHRTPSTPVAPHNSSESSPRLRGSMLGEASGRPRKRKRRKTTAYPFSCPFNIFRPSYFCQQYGPEGHNRYKPCQGPGWSEVRRLK